MILSDHDLRTALKSGAVFIEPLDMKAQLQPASIDLRLGHDFLLWQRAATHVIDVYDDVTVQQDTERLVLKDDGSEPLIIAPGRLVLGCTLETVSIGPDLVGRVEGRSSLGRLGIIVHATAGYIDPGFKGKITLEIVNLNHLTIKLWPGMRISQLSVMQLTSTAEKPYAGKYQHDDRPTLSRIARDWQRR